MSTQEHKIKDATDPSVYLVKISGVTQGYYSAAPTDKSEIIIGLLQIIAMCGNFKRTVLE